MKGIIIIYRSYLKIYIFLSLFGRFLFKWACAGAEKSSVDPWTAVWHPRHGGMFPKLFSRTLISRETFRSIYKGEKGTWSNHYRITAGNTRFEQSETRFFSIGIIWKFTKLNCSLLFKSKVSRIFQPFFEVCPLRAHSTTRVQRT